MPPVNQALVIAYYYPPLGGGGVLRTVGYTKYMRQFGWQPVVLTVKPRSSMLQDSSLSAEIPPDTPVYRTNAVQLPGFLPWRLRYWFTRWVLLTDSQRGWARAAARSGLEIIHDSVNQGNQIKIIYTTAPPYTGHIIGEKIKRQAGIPWIADFRDAWIGNPNLRFPTTWHKDRAAWLEQRTIEQCDAALFVSDPMRSQYAERYPACSQKFFTLTNGYDPQAFPTGENQTASQRERKDGDQLSIVYNGSFYGSQQTPIYFLTALESAIAERHILRGSIRLYLVGSIASNILKAIEQLGLNDMIEIKGYLPHQNSLEWLKKADLLLLIVGPGPGSDAVMTGKIYEYLASRKPILALVPVGAARSLILSAEAGEAVDPTDIPGIKEKIIELYHRWENGALACSSRSDVIEQYDRKKITGQLCAIMDALRDEDRAAEP